MKRFSILAVLMMFLFLCGNAMAYTVTFDSKHEDTIENETYKSIDHSWAYYWGIDLTNIDISSYTNPVVTASITLEGIENWGSDDGGNTIEYEDYVYISLLDNANTSGVTYYEDEDDDFKDFFETYDGYLYLTQYSDQKDKTSKSNTPDNKDNYTYFFDAEALAALLSGLSDGYIAIGIDPDCHYTYDKIYLTINIEDGPAPVPEPATMTLFGAGLVAFASMARRRLKKS